MPSEKVGSLLNCLPPSLVVNRKSVLMWTGPGSCSVVFALFSRLLGSFLWSDVGQVGFLANAVATAMRILKALHL